AVLAKRTPVRQGPPTLLTVANPAYPQIKSVKEVVGSNVVLGLAGELPPLPFTAVESQRIRERFQGRVLALEREEATEGTLRAALPGRHIVHVAAHGFADERFGNLFGALALAPPKASKDPASEDGFLSLHEIYRLPLSSCELAVLSA